MALVAVLTACGDDKEEDLPEVDCPSDVPTFSEVTAFSEACVQCHSSTLTGPDRQNAPVGLDFDTHAAASANAEKAAEEVNEGEMPPKGSGLTLTEEQKKVLYEWALCGTPQ